MSDPEPPPEQMMAVMPSVVAEQPPDVLHAQAVELGDAIDSAGDHDEPGVDDLGSVEDLQRIAGESSSDEGQEADVAIDPAQLRPELAGALAEHVSGPEIDRMGSAASAASATRERRMSTAIVRRRISGGGEAPASLKEFNEAKRRQSMSMAGLPPKMKSSSSLRRVHPEDNTRRMSGLRQGRESGLQQGSLPARRASVTAVEIDMQRSSKFSMDSAERFSCCRNLRYRAVPYCRFINRSKYFQIAMFGALLAALFLPDVWILSDRPGNDDLDVLLTVILCLFLVELGVQSVALTRTYVGSFFFWMDLIGAFSLLLDLSYIGIFSSISDSGGVGEQVVIMRTARIAKLGARAGRFTKLVKLLRFLPGMGGMAENAGTAKAINAKLIQALSTRVSCLIISMIMLTPLFSMWTFPESDDSMQSWLDHLDLIVKNRPEVLSRELAKFDAFYVDLAYYPFQVTARSGANLPNGSMGNLPWSSSRPHPIREDSVQARQSEHLVIDFNFRAPNQMDSGMNLLLLVFVMILLISFSMVLQSATSKIVLIPLEKLLMQVRDTASLVFQSVKDMKVEGEEEGAEDPEEEENNADTKTSFKSEMALLEKVVKKIAKMQKQEEKEEEADTWAGGGRKKEQSEAVVSAPKKRLKKSEASEVDDDVAEVLLTEVKMLEDSGHSLEMLKTWNLNTLEIDKVRNKAAMMFFVGPTDHGIRCDKFAGAFMDAAAAGHNKSNPYHSWFHAVDVTHTLWRYTHMCELSAYVQPHEHLAILVAAVCHDIGHPGLNNAFLIETSHELAMIYNDRSPLENMSCAKLFELLRMPGCNLFEVLSPGQYSEARKVCIQAILHTDNAQHFAMIKDVQMFYEMNSEVMDAAREHFKFEEEEEDRFPTVDALEVFKEPPNKTLLLNLMLHMADISNSTKPFRICRTWANKVLEEFFRQGDKEKELGLPVQALNDRNTVNPAFSQIGFIEFLVAPLLMTVIKVLPPIEPALKQMMLNVKNWHRSWLSEKSPPPSDSEKQALSDRVHKLQLRLKECRISAQTSTAT